MTKEEISQYRILDAIEVCSTIICTKCRNHNDYHGLGEFLAASKIIDDGWYATNQNVYCPDCNKKRLKQLK